MSHHALKVGDVVLLKEENSKAVNYPMGIVRRVECNSLGEVTGAIVHKGKTKEEVKRHVSALIPLLSYQESDSSNGIKYGTSGNKSDDQEQKRERRKAAIDSEIKTKNVLKL